MRALLFLLALPSLALAQEDYELRQPPREVYTDLRQSFTIVASHAVEIDQIKPHPKITWLDHSMSRSNDSTIHTEIGFVVRAPGLIEFPPIPVVIENKSFFLRLNDITARRNPAPKDLGKFEVLWNKDLEMPETVHLGEALDVDFIGQLPREAGSRVQFLGTPTNRVENAKWYLFTRQRGRNARSEDYFYNFSSNGSGSRINGFFFGPRERRFVERNGNVNGDPVVARQFKARMICSELGEVNGHLGMTLAKIERNREGHMVDYERTYLIPFRFNVVPLPPIPSESLVNTGLVGDWEISAAIGPSVPTANQPLHIQLDLTGRGDPTLRREFDFSREGFASVESRMVSNLDTNYEEWNGQFTQTLIPSGNVATFPAVTLASFDTVNDKWKLHPVTPALSLDGKVDHTRDLAPAAQLGGAIARPVLLNLPRAIFPIIALAPFLPFLFGFAKKRLDQRDPVRKERQQKIRALVSRFRSGKGSAETIDDELLPLLRAHLDLPSGASTREVADTLKNKHGALASLLRDHSKASFSGGGSGIDLKNLATQLAKVSFLFLLIGQLRAVTLEEANLAFSEDRYSDALAAYQNLIEENPGQPRLYQNLALTYLAIDDPARARAACHTALLLAPLDSEARALMSDIRQRVGAPALPGTSLLALRPDQWFILAAFLWVLGFALLGLRHFPQIKIPHFIALIAFVLAIVFLATGIWRNSHIYAEQQFMIIGDDLPREPTPGTPDWDFPTLKSGLIIEVAEISKTHARIQTDGSSFWLPLSQLQQVW